MNSPWFTPAPANPGPVRLFCFPYAGGAAASFQPWQALLGPQVELRVALLPGRGARLFEPLLHDMDELVGHLAGAMAEEFAAGGDKPFALFGHSLGALIAFEVARALRTRGLPSPVSLWLSGEEGPQTRSLTGTLHDLPDAEMIDRLRDYNGTPDELLDDPEMMELLLPGIRADFALDECYTYRAEAPLDVPVHVLRGDQDPTVDAERSDGWARESSLPLTRHLYSGDHFFLDSHEPAITALLAGELAADDVNAR
jgi:medium-chain acyl-[acyl-carrier-protein] hydrolase